MIYLIIIFLITGCSAMPIDKHIIPINKYAQLISPCGGGNDENGILWTISGDFYQYPGEDTIKLEEKYAKWYPSINSKSMVVIGGGVPIPPGKNVVKDWRERYEKLIKNSKIKYVNINGTRMITREEI